MSPRVIKPVEHDWIRYRNSKGEILDCHILDFGRLTAIDDMDVISIGTADFQYRFYTLGERGATDGIVYDPNNSLDRWKN